MAFYFILTLLNRKLTDRFKKSLYYPMHDIEGGIMANMEDVIRNTLPEILKNQNYKPEKDAILHLELGFGMDGAGL